LLQRQLHFYRDRCAFVKLKLDNFVDAFNDEIAPRHPVAKHQLACLMIVRGGNERLQVTSRIGETNVEEKSDVEFFEVFTQPLQERATFNDIMSCKRVGTSRLEL